MESSNGPKTEDLHNHSTNNPVGPVANPLSLANIISLVRRNRTKSNEEELAEYEKFKKRRRTDLSDPNITLEHSLHNYITGSESQARENAARFATMEKAYASKVLPAPMNESTDKNKTQSVYQRPLSGNYNFLTPVE